MASEPSARYEINPYQPSMGSKKSKLELELERSLKYIAEAKQKVGMEQTSLAERLRELDDANKPDALAGDEAFEDEADDDRTGDWWD